MPITVGWRGIFLVKNIFGIYSSHLCLTKCPIPDKVSVPTFQLSCQIVGSSISRRHIVCSSQKCLFLGGSNWMRVARLSWFTGCHFPVTGCCIGGDITKSSALVLFGPKHHHPLRNMSCHNCSKAALLYPSQKLCHCMRV